MNKSLILIASILALSVTPALQAQFFMLNPGDGLVNGVSDNGIAVGNFDNSDDEYFSWEIGVGGKINIGGVTAGNGIGGQASISNDGTRVVGTDFNSVSGLHEMSYYDMAGGSWTPVGGIGSSSGSSISSGWGISGDGQSLVGLGWVSAGEAHAIHWSGGTMTDLGSTVANRSSRANATNFDGTVVGGWQDANSGFRQGAVWVNGVQELIFNDFGEAVDEVSAISNNGQYATGLSVLPPLITANAYRYDIDNDTFSEVANIMDTTRMGGTAISADGTLIGGGMWDLGPATSGDGFIWEEGVGTMLVTDYLTAHGVSGWDPNFEFSFVSGISTDGQWLVGWGRDANSNNVSWAARIQSVPEPTTLGLLLFAGAVSLCPRRRRS